MYRLVTIEAVEEETQRSRDAPRRYRSDADRSMRSDRAWLLDILDAIGGIARYRPQTRAAFDEDERTQVWMVNRQLRTVLETDTLLEEEP